MAHTMQMSKTTRACGRKVDAPFRPATSMVVRSSRSACRPQQVSSMVAPSSVRVPSIIPRAAAAPSAPETAKPTEKKEYYALLANAEFYVNDVQNESMAEQLRERVRFFKEQNREIDFWLVPEPKWLDAKYPEQAKKVKRPCIALISSDKMWITFMKLRLDRVLRIDLGAIDEKEALAVGGEIPEYPAPAKWTAPYARYTPGWWKVFVPQQ